MGSINCKEYSTTRNYTPNTDITGKGTAGSYQSKCELPTVAASGGSDGVGNKNKGTTMMMEYTDPVRVCELAELKDNEMKQVVFDEDTRIILIKQRGVLKAIGSKCPHYGAPLHTGALSNGRVRCPWHGACFNIDTGDIEDFPGLDSLPCYKVQVADDGGVMVRAKRSDLVTNKRLKKMMKRDPKDKRCFIVVGGGPSGAVCAETLRQEGYTGRLVFVCREPYLPYDRVKVSKAMNSEIGQLQFREAAFYAEYDIEVMLSVSAVSLDTKKKILNCSNGYALKYDKIYIATGSSAKKSEINGSNLKNVFTVREYADAVAINEAITPDSHVVCLGSSFIALEAAAYMADKVETVTIIGRDTAPLKTILGDKIGNEIFQLFEDNGVAMVMESGLLEIIGDDDGNINAVRVIDPAPPLEEEEEEEEVEEEEIIEATETSGDENKEFTATDAIDGEEIDPTTNNNGSEIEIGMENDELEKDKAGTILIPCDILIVGIGSKLNTEFLEGSGVLVNPNGSINVNHFMETNVPDVYVGGDIANANIHTLGRELVNIGHYQLAQYHGRIAAINMCGTAKKLEAVPFFFTMLFGKGIRYAGYGTFTDIVYDGDLENFKFVAYFVNSSDSVVAVASCGRDPIVAQYAELMSQGKCLTRSNIEDPKNRQAWTAMLIPTDE